MVVGTNANLRYERPQGSNTSLRNFVLSEGDEDDVRFYVRFDELRTSWPHLFIPRHVREAWEKQYPQLVGVR